MEPMTFDYSLFVDSGAPSLYNRLSKNEKMRNGTTMGSTFRDRKFDTYEYVNTEVYQTFRKGYIEFLKKHKKQLSVYSNLDVINNAELTYENQKLLESEGLSPIPVFHLGNDEKWLKMYVKKYDYIALGGLIPNPTNVLIPILDRVFKEHILDKDGYPKVKVHGFACTSFRLMRRYPWYSVDSTSARKSGAYGRIFLPTYTDQGNLASMSISSRIELQYLAGPALLKEIEQRCEQYNLTLEGLCNSHSDRGVWNNLIYLEKIKNDLLPWPWSFEKNRSKPGATERLHYYIAGEFSVSEEIDLWKKMEELNIEPAYKRRLISFYYQTSALRAVRNEWVIKEKKI